MDAGAVTLRLAHARDARVMALMSRDTIEAGLGWRYDPQQVAALVAERNSVALVACDGAGKLLGFAVMRFGDEHAHLQLLAVQPGRRRLGIGGRLLQWLVESAEVAGIASIRLELRADNAGARAFYRRAGFGDTVVVPDYYARGVAAQRMVRLLRAPR